MMTFEELKSAIMEKSIDAGVIVFKMERPLYSKAFCVTENSFEGDKVYGYKLNNGKRYLLNPYLFGIDGLIKSPPTEIEKIEIVHKE